MDDKSLFEDTLSNLLGNSADPVAAGWHLRQLATAAAPTPQELLTEVVQSRQLPDSDPAILGGLLRVMHIAFLEAGRETIEAIDPQQLASILRTLPAETPNRHLLLQLLALIHSQESLLVLIDLLKSDPPQQWIHAAQTLSPLMQHRGWPTAIFFPAALDCLQHPTLASPLLDLANYLFRTGQVAEHPAAERLPMLNRLLGDVSGRLSNFEDNPRTFGDDVNTVHKVLGEAVALAVSLCDTLGLIGHESSIGKLNQAIQLKHRRVQCEAAGALAKFDDDLGKKRLLELTADPAARLRAIAYADELGFGELVDEQQRTDTATAEAEMVLWLSQPQQMGVAPTSVEVIESRRFLWPSFTDQIDVFLVRFEYSFGEQIYSNVGITGPVTFALAADVANLPTDDIFAIYAGWHAEHPEIFVVPADQFNDTQTRIMGTYQKHLLRQGYESLKPALLGFFLDEQAAIFTAVRDATECVVVTDGSETIDHPTAGRSRPLSPNDLFNLYKGRKMLRTFNPDWMD